MRNQAAKGSLAQGRWASYPPLVNAFTGGLIGDIDKKKFKKIKLIGTHVTIATIGTNKINVVSKICSRANSIEICLLWEQK